MKQKRRRSRLPAWTPFQEATGHNLAGLTPAMQMLIDQDHQDHPYTDFVNSRYQVGVTMSEDGMTAYLTIKDHERTTRHDWRDFQRIKNELLGPEWEAVEVYPAESRLVDTCNQYHLYASNGRFPFGFETRIVADGGRQGKSKQRSFEVRPDDCLTEAELDAMTEDLAAKVGEKIS